jgi:hypothetical protein
MHFLSRPTLCSMLRPLPIARRAALALARRNFAFTDGSGGQPSQAPSGLSDLNQYNEYAHWGGNSTSYEPDSAIENCVIATPFYKEYYYFNGANTTTDRRNTALYIATAGQNVWAWAKVRALPCTALKSS